LADLANAALHHDEDDVVIVEQRRRMPVAHRRQRSACHGKAGQRPQRQVDRERVALEWIDFNAKNFAAENLAKRIEAAIIVKGLGRDPERLHFVVRHACGSIPCLLQRPLVASWRDPVHAEQIFRRLNR
jgi:hypothetical protein